jgi:hypothetical protein
MKEGRASNDDLLGLLMESNVAETKQAGNSRPIMTMGDIIGELKLFYFAGMDTTAVLLTWTMVVLSMHPEWQHRAREEVLRVFGNNQPDLDGIHQLKIVSTRRPRLTRIFTGNGILTRSKFHRKWNSDTVVSDLFAGNHDTVRGSQAVPAGGTTGSADAQGDRAGRRHLPDRGGTLAAHRVHPPRQGRVGGRRRRVQAGEVHRRHLQGVQGLTGVLPVRLGAADLRRPEFRAGRGQDGAQQHPAALLLRALAVLHARAVPGLHSAARTWGTDHAEETLASVDYGARSAISQELSVGASFSLFFYPPCRLSG